MAVAIEKVSSGMSGSLENSGYFSPSPELHSLFGFGNMSKLFFNPAISDSGRIFQTAPDGVNAIVLNREDVIM